MAQTTLNLGSVLSQLLKDANSNFEELYDAVSDLQEANAEKGTQRAVVYQSADAMVSGLNAGKDGANNDLALVIGDEIYILDDDTPDFWIAGVNEQSSQGGKPVSWESGENYTFGKYVIRISKTREIELTDYQTVANLVTTLSDNSDNSHYPSAKVVHDAIKSLQNQLGTMSGTIANTYAKKTDLHSHNNQTVLDNFTEVDGNLQYNEKPVGAVQTISINGENPISPENGNINLDLSDISVDVDELVSGYETVTPKTVAIDDKTYTAIEVEDTDITLELFNMKGEAVVTQVIKYNGYIYYVLSDNDTSYYTLRIVGGNAVSGGGGSADLTERVENLEKKAFYEHSVTFSASNISISSIDYGENALMTRSGSIENAIIIRVNSNSTALNNTNMVAVNNHPLSIMGYLKISMSMTNFENVIYCPIKSISNDTITDTYTIVYIDNKTAYTSLGDPILVSEEVSVDIPYSNIVVTQDKVTKIL